MDGREHTRVTATELLYLEFIIGEGELGGAREGEMGRSRSGWGGTGWSRGRQGRDRIQ